jgi:hypothetical protein
MSDWLLRVRLQIHANQSAISSSDRWLRFEVTLPFVPFLGLEIMDPRLDGEIHCPRVGWSVKEQCFVTAMEDKTLYHDHQRAQRAGELEALVNEYLEAGWQLDPERP